MLPSINPPPYERYLDTIVRAKVAAIETARQSATGIHRHRQGGGAQGHSQMRVVAARVVGAEAGRRRDLHRRFRVCRSSGRRRCRRHGADPRGGTSTVGADHRVGRHRRRSRHGRCAHVRCRWRQHGHALLRHARSADPRQHQTGARRGQRTRHAPDLSHHAQHRSRAQKRDLGGGGRR